MSKINISFNNTDYQIDESSLSAASSALRTHLSTTMSGSGATINLGGTSYNVDITKLFDSTNDFVSHLRTIAGSGHKVYIGGIEYPIDASKVKVSIADLETVLGNLNDPDDVVDIVIVLDEAILDEHVLG